MGDADSKLIKTDQHTPKTSVPEASASVDFFNDRDYWKIFLETSKE